MTFPEIPWVVVLYYMLIVKIGRLKVPIVNMALLYYYIVILGYTKGCTRWPLLPVSI